LTKPIKAGVLHEKLVQILAVGAVTRAHEPSPPERVPELAALLPLKILLAEDNVINQKVAGVVLQRLGYRPDVAASGLEVIEALRRQAYDVILMDIQMPEMNGLEATARIREGLADRQPYIIAITANATVQDREACLSAGMDDYIAKPFRTEELVSALKRQRGSGSPRDGTRVAP
jgi:CheY-like chemotaxis protein